MDLEAGTRPVAEVIREVGELAGSLAQALGD